MAIEKRDLNKLKNNLIYDKSTDTYYVMVGQCTYCNVDLFKNEGLNHGGYENVNRADNRIIKLCTECARYMHARGDLIEIVIKKNGSDYSYEFPTDANTEEEKKKKRRAV